MKNFAQYFVQTLEFTKAYIKSYLYMMIIPIIIALIGVLAMLPLIKTANPFFGLLAIFITIPALCFAFWRGYLIAYSLNYAAWDFSKNQEMLIDLKSALAKTKEKGNKIALYTIFVSLVTLLLCLPVLIYFAFQIKFCIDYSILSRTALHKYTICTSLLLINLILLLPFTNYALQAFFFKKKDEKFLDLFVNCYKKLDFTGFLIGVFNLVVSCIMVILPSYLYVIFMILFVLFSFPISTFWYYQKCLTESK